MAEFRMPALGAEMDAGTIVQWLVKPGDSVKRGDIVALVDTEKATIEVEVFESGTVASLLVPEGQQVAVGTVLALIGGASETPVSPPLTPPRVTAVAPTTPAEQTLTAPPRAARPSAGGPEPKRRHISPLAVRIAQDLKVDLASVKGTGPEGAITRRDVEQAAAATAVPPAARSAATAPAAVELEAAGTARATPERRQAAMRRVIAAAMSRSKREIPHYYLGTQVDLSRALTWLQDQNLKRSVADRVLPSALLIKAVAKAVREVPEVNGWWVNGAFAPGAGVHIGFAISMRQGGLIAPALHDVDKKSLVEVMSDLRDLVKRVRAGVLRGSEIADATITVTSLGERGVEIVFGVIYPPQVALVGFGKIVERPWARDGMIGARPIVTATLAGDHRASDGHRGGLFLAAVERHLQEPETL